MTPAEYDHTIDLYADDVYRFALRCCGDKSLCDDVVQEAFAALWEQCDNVIFDDCRGFLITVVRRRIVDSFRHSQVTQSARYEMSVGLDNVATPFEAYDLNDAIVKAFEQLTDLQRTILTLHDIEGYDYREIAGIIEQKYTSVQVNAFRARMKMKEILIKMKIR